MAIATRWLPSPPSCHLLSAAYLFLLLLLVSGCDIPEPIELATPEAVREVEPARIFWVNSYTSDNLWALQIQSGVWETLAREGYTFVDGTLEWGTFHMGATQVMPAEEIVARADEAIAAIQSFAPDVVIVSDDEAAQTVLVRYPEAETGESIPFVFCGVNEEVQSAGLIRLNVTGVTERQRPVQTVALARSFTEGEGNYLVMSDASSTGWASVVPVYLELIHRDPEVYPLLRVVKYWDGWQKAVLKEGPNVDFILLVSQQSVLDEEGQPVPERDMMAWMLEHSPVPVFALSNQAVLYGAVGGLVPYGYDQGAMAAQLAVRVLRGTHPSSIAIRVPARNRLILNSAAAKNWDLQIPVMFPVSADVYNTVPRYTESLEGGSQ